MVCFFNVKQKTELKDSFVMVIQQLKVTAGGLLFESLTLENRIKKVKLFVTMQFLKFENPGRVSIIH